MMLKKVFKVSESFIGYAGLKDKHGVTRQWFSIANSKWDETLVQQLTEVKVLKHSYHDNKLRLSHLRGNKFKIVLRGDIEKDQNKLDKIKNRILEKGIPNFFGTQRFGYQGKNIDTGYSLFKEEHLQKKIRSKEKEASLFLLCNLFYLTNTLIED